MTPSGRLEDPTLADVVLAARSAGGRGVAARSARAGARPSRSATRDRRRAASQRRARRARDRRVGRPRRAIRARPARRSRQPRREAEHIGAAAREARRAARIAELRDTDRLARGGDRGSRAQASSSSIAAARRSTAELDALPPVDAVARRSMPCASPRRSRPRPRARTSRRPPPRAMAADAELAADAARREHAAAHGLPSPLDEAGARGPRATPTAELAGAAAAVGTRVERSPIARRGPRTTVAARLSEAQRGGAASQDRHARDEAGRGQSVWPPSTPRARRRSARPARSFVAVTRRSRRHCGRTGDTPSRGRDGTAGADRGRRTGAGRCTYARREHEAARAAARAGEHRLPAARAGGDPADWSSATPCPPTPSSAAGWTFTRTLEVARALPAASCSRCAARTGSSASRSSAASSCSTESWRRPTWARTRAAARTSCCSCTSPKAAASSRSREILETLSAEIADREQILTAEERRVFSDALVEEIADHLRAADPRGARPRRADEHGAASAARPPPARTSSSSGSHSTTTRTRSGPRWRCCGAMCATSARTARR